MKVPESNRYDEKTLIKRLKQGQQWACQVLVTNYQDRLLKIAYGITLDHEESREIVQDVFISAIKHIHTYRQDAGLYGWLRKITVNACLNWKRKWTRRFRWHHTSLEPGNEFLLNQLAMDGPTPESRLREKEYQKRLAKAIQGLDEKYRVVFVLKTIEGLSYEEISTTLGIKKGTVSSRLSGARKKLLAAMEETNQNKPEGTKQ